MVLLYKYKARNIGLNQIQSTFIKELEKDANTVMST